MTRIVAGRLGGRRIAVPSGRQTRPTSDRVREALFGSLQALIDLDGVRFADLYAGSGAIGIEALSRGAASALFVESHPATARLIRGNLAALELERSAIVLSEPVERVLQRSPAEPFHVIFADPPYQIPDTRLREVLNAMVINGWMADDALIVVERSSRSGELSWVPGITGLHSRRYGETTLWYGRRS